MIARLVLFGATGDLAGRFLFPALARGLAAGDLPEDLAVVAAAPQDWDDETFATHIAQQLAAHAGQVPAGVRDALVARLRYRPVDLDDATSIARAVHGFAGPADSGDPVAVYLALPPTLFTAAVAALATADLPAGSRIAVEKPFGADLAGAVALDALLVRVGGPADAIFRVDHALAMPGVTDLLDLRRRCISDGAGWDGSCIEQVDVLWEETIGLEGRADFFDRTGALRDVMQNHLLQILALVAMEPPPTSSERDLHEAKLQVLRSIRVLRPGEVAAQTARARYTAGELADGTAAAVPDYTSEAGVDPNRGTETWAELRLEIGGPRWVGTTFVLRAGKALAVGRKGVLLHLRDTTADAPTGGPTGLTAAATAAGQVWIGLDGSPAADAPGVPGELVAYGRVLVDVLGSGNRLSVSGPEAEATWRIVEPVLDAWADGSAPLTEYRAGSTPGLNLPPPARMSP